MFKRYIGAMRANVNFTLGGKPVSFYMAFGSLSIEHPSLADVTLCATSMVTHVTAQLPQVTSPELQYSDVTVTSLFSATDYQFTSPFATNTQGINGTDSLPRNVAFCVQRTTGLSGRLGRGRVYLPGVPEVVCNGGSAVSVGYANGCANVMEFIQSGVETDLASSYSGVTLSNESVGGLGGEYRWYLIENWRYSTLQVATRRKRL